MTRAILIASEVSWAQLLGLVFPRLMYVISHERKRITSLLSTKENLCRRLRRPCSEFSRAGKMCHSLIDRKIEFGVVKPRFGRCSPIA